MQIIVHLEFVALDQILHIHLEQSLMFAARKQRQQHHNLDLELEQEQLVVVLEQDQISLSLISKSSETNFMPTTIDSAGITFNDATSLTSALIPTTSLTGTITGTQIANGSVTAAKLGTNEQKQIAKAWVNFDGTFATSPFTVGNGIRLAYNISSVVKIGTGVYTINFTNPLPTSSYCFTASIEGSNLYNFSTIHIVQGSITASSIGVDTKSTSSNAQTFFDMETVNLVIYY